MSHDVDIYVSPDVDSYVSPDVDSYVSPEVDSYVSSDADSYASPVRIGRSLALRQHVIASHVHWRSIKCVAVLVTPATTPNAYLSMV